jgi:hypothetical protein
MQDGVNLSRLKSVDDHKNIIKLYSNDVIVIQNLILCQNYKCFSKRSRCLIWNVVTAWFIKLNLKICKKNIVPPLSAAVSHELKSRCSSAPGLRGANGTSPPRRTGEQKTEWGNLRIHNKDSRKRPKLKRNHKQHPSTMKIYPIIPSVRVTPEKVYVDIAV